tara:strand:+ start:386 stop:889 length:504 start_codon:yes stop_codon:yes gene_type:complete
MSDKKDKKIKAKSELAIRELEEAYKTYTDEDYDKVYGYTDEDYAYGINCSSTWPPMFNTGEPLPDLNWSDPDDIIYSHGELPVGTLVRHDKDIGIVMKKLDIGVTDDIIRELEKSGIVLNAVSMDNILGSWDFKHGYDNNFYSVALTGKTKRILAIGWKLKEISRDE